MTVLDDEFSTSHVPVLPLAPLEKDACTLTLSVTVTSCF